MSLLKSAVQALSQQLTPEQANDWIGTLPVRTFSLGETISVTGPDGMTRQRAATFAIEVRVFGQAADCAARLAPAVAFDALSGDPLELTEMGTAVWTARLDALARGCFRKYVTPETASFFVEAGR